MRLLRLERGPLLYRDKGLEMESCDEGREKSLRSATLAKAGEDIFGGGDSREGEWTSDIISLEIWSNLHGPAHRPAQVPY